MQNRKERVVKVRPDWRKNGQVKKLKITMTIIAVALCLSVAAGGILAWLQVNHMVAGVKKDAAVMVPVSSVSSSLPVYDDSLNLLLVNSSNPLPSGYHPQMGDFQGIAVDSRIIPALQKMMSDASSAGVPLTLNAGYVDSPKQDELYQAEVKRLMSSQKLSQVIAENKAQSSVGRGGYSENQTGLSVIFGAKGQNGSFASTSQYRWLVNNSVNYGFILRFSQSKESVTGMSFEAGRFRYVGSDNAIKMRELSMCLEEYVTYRSDRAQN